VASGTSNGRHTGPGRIRQVQLVGGKIRKLRKEHKLTQNELAQRIGVQQSDLSRMEKGEYRVSLDTLFKILAEFDMGIGEFFDDLARTAFSPQDIQLIRDLRSLPNEDQREIIEFIGFKRTRAQPAGPAPADHHPADTRS
jgi:transcriptional regulator with XRE-family HTH domain